MSPVEMRCQCNFVRLSVILTNWLDLLQFKGKTCHCRSQKRRDSEIYVFHLWDYIFWNLSSVWFVAVIFSKEHVVCTFSCPKMEAAARLESLIKNILILYFTSHNTTVFIVTLSAMCKSLLVCNHCFCLI